MIQDVKMDSIVDRISRGVKLLKFCSTATRSQSPKSRLQTQVPPYADNLDVRYADRPFGHQSRCTKRLAVGAWCRDVCVQSDVVSQ